MIRLACALLLLGLAGCASMGGAIPVAIGAACYTCQMIEASGFCPVAGTRGFEAPKTPCPPGYQLYILNYDRVVKHLEDPKWLCR